MTTGGITFSGVYAATTTPLRDAGDVDFGEFAKHCAGLADEGVTGIVPNGSLGEYEARSDAEREQMVTTVQAIKLAQEEAGRYGGPVRLPRLPLPPDEAARVRAAVRAALRATAEGGA